MTKSMISKKQPAPAENVQVCEICLFDPTTCDHNKNREIPLDPEFIRKACVWCADWQPGEDIDALS